MLVALLSLSARRLLPSLESQCFPHQPTRRAAYAIQTCPIWCPQPTLKGNKRATYSLYKHQMQCSTACVDSREYASAFHTVGVKGGTLHCPASISGSHTPSVTRKHLPASCTCNMHASASITRGVGCLNADFAAAMQKCVSLDVVEDLSRMGFAVLDKVFPEPVAGVAALPLKKPLYALLQQFVRVH
jgi:hypothetical protein